MNYIKYLIIALYSSAIFMSCSNEETLPAPKFEFNNSDKETVIRRDTSESYKIVANFESPNGLDKITVIDGLTYETIEEFTKFENNKEIKFEYMVDLSKLDIDTTLVYLFRVKDKAGKTFNDAFSIQLIKSSRPEIKLLRDSMGTQATDYPLIGKVETGFNPIEEVKLYFNGTLLKDYNITELEDPSSLNFNDLMTDLTLGNNEVRIYVKDKKGQEAEDIMRITRVANTNSKVTLMVKTTSRGSVYKYYYTYDESGRLIQLGLRKGDATTNYYTYDFIYGENGMVSNFIRNSSSSEYNYIFEYEEGTSNVTRLTKKYTKKSTGSVTEGILAQNFTHTDGQITSYYVNGTTFYPSYIDAWGEQINVDYLYGSYTLDKYRYAYSLLERIPNPAYIPNIPYILNEKIPEKFYFHKYIFNTLYMVIDDTCAETYSFQQDDKARVSSMAIKSNKFGTTSYQFYYDN